MSMTGLRTNPLRTILSFISNLSLTIKVAVTASVVFLVFVLSICYVSFRHFEQEFKNTIYAQQASLVTSLARNIDDKLRITLNALTASANKLDAETFSNPDLAQRFLDSELALHSMFDTGLFLIDRNGKLVAESPFRPDRRGRDLSEREYFSQSAQLQKPYISKPYAASRNNREPALRMTTPVFDRQGQFLGILAGRLDLQGSNILSQIGKTRNGIGGYVFMTDSEGNMILHPDQKRLLKSAIGSNPLFDRAFKGFSGTGEVVNSYGKHMIMTITHLQTSGWVLASNYPKEEADAPFERALHFVTATLIIGLIVLLILISTLMKRLIKPLIEFTAHVETLPQKPEAERLFPTRPGAEIGILVKSFNKMILSLAEQRQELQLHQEQLEILVQERTTDLHQAQQIGHIGNWKLMFDIGSIYWSDEIYRILGYAPNQFIATYERLLAARHPDDALSVQHSENIALETEDQHSVDYRIVLPDGCVRWVHEEVRAERNSSGQILSLSGTLQDISERKLVEQALIESREAAESASRAKSLFLSSMSHELRTPLNAVLGFAQLLAMDEEVSDEVRSNATEIELAGRHLLDLVSDILDLARIESGRIDLSIEDMDPMLVLNECHSLLEAQTKPHHISWQRPAHLPHLRADRIRLRQIFLNLLSNAIKYNRDGGRIDIKGNISNHGRYRISITDTGIGIPASRLHELFQPFNRIGAERGQIEGTGIGLVITKTLVQAMQGEIGVESVFGQGTTFWFELPMVQAPPLSRRELPLHNCILAAEDHEPNRKLLRQQIEKLGYQVEFAFDGNEALQMWQAGHYQLLLTDCNMPVMDGYELAQAVRKRETVSGQHIPIVALTANSAKDAAKACIAAGMDDFLVKPVHLNQLKNTLDKWLGPHPDKTATTTPPEKHLPPAYDDYLQTLVQMLGDDNPEEAGLMLQGFLASARECMQEAHDAFEPRNASGFVRAAHKLKSSARMIGATALADLCQRAEQAGLRKDWDLMQLELPNLAAALRETEERILALPTTQSAPGDQSASDSQDKSGSDAAPAQQREPNPELAQLQVMLIDDDPFILNYLKRLLTARGVEQIRCASEGKAALAELQQGGAAIDVTVCDLNMPGMDGVEFLRHLADAGYTGALIIISGNADLLPTIYELAQAHGLRILGTLAKPFTPQRFFDILYLQLGERRSARPRSKVPMLRPLDVVEALRQCEFVPWFQPKVDAHTLKPYGAEALARWQRLDGNVISPFAFVPLMEVHGLIDELFIAMLGQTLSAARTLQENGFGDLKLAVNLAASTLGTLNLPDIIDQQLQQYQVGPDKLILEITESGLMHDARIGLDVLLRLRLKGIGLSIDDFGTGYSTIDQLRRLPFTELKVDQSFVASAAKNPASQIILQSSIEMARRLNLRTVAEGVETEQDLELIRKLGCDVVQGFLVAKPMPLGKFMEWLREHGG
jgi:PAS domain S-box-containing protein